MSSSSEDQEESYVYLYFIFMLFIGIIILIFGVYLWYSKYNVKIVYENIEVPIS
jgi:hypothetical protein